MNSDQDLAKRRALVRAGSSKPVPAPTPASEADKKPFQKSSVKKGFAGASRAAGPGKPKFKKEYQDRRNVKSENDVSSDGTASTKKFAGKRKAVDEPGGADGSEQQKSAKKAKFKRVKPNAELVQQAKVLWEEVRRKKLEPEKRTPVLRKLLALIRGKVKEIVMKHDASRVVQTCLKYGTEADRQAIIEQLKGTMLDLCKSHYGHFLATKLLFYARGHRAGLLAEFHGKVGNLLKHKEASAVIEYAYTDVANAKQRSDMVTEFYGAEFALFKSDEKRTLDEIVAAEPDKKAPIARTLARHIATLSNKGAAILRHSIVHHIILDFFRIADAKAIAEMVGTLREQVVEMCHTREGAKVAVACVSYGNVKDRKIMIKNLKGYVEKVCTEEFAHLMVLRMLDVTDDTLLVSKAILSDVLKSLGTIMTDRYGRLVLLHILSPRNTRYFPPSTIALLQPTMVPDEKGELVPTSRKDPNTRQKELRDFLLPGLVSHCVEHCDTIIKSQFGSQVLLETAKVASGDQQEQLFSAIVALTDAEEDNILDNIYATLVLKILIKSEGLSFASKLADGLANKQHWAVQKGSSYVIVSLLENQSSQTKTQADLLPHLAQLRSVCDDKPGCKIIVQHLQPLAPKAEQEPAAKGNAAKRKKKS